MRFTASWSGRDAPAVRAWVQRPDSLRVETPEGELLQAGIQERGGGTAQLLAGPTDVPPPPRPPLAVAPALDDDGLVRVRPSTFEVEYDDPMFRDYRWVAMLDPVELAEGHGRWLDRPPTVPVLIDEIHEVDHHGRPAWEALLRPTDDYDPRCSCCELLRSEGNDVREAQERGAPWPDGALRPAYADAHRVRLDVATGVCVFTEELGGGRSGYGHTLVIEAVDEAMDASRFDTFPAPRRRFMQRAPWTR